MTAPVEHGMSPGIFIGVDPGPIPGIVALTVWGDGSTEAAAIQCTAGITTTVVRGLLVAAQVGMPVTVAVERFVVGKASMRSAAAGATTRDLVGQLQQLVRDQGPEPRVMCEVPPRYVERSASEVKPWATDTRLARVDLLEPTKGMRHARDAARHALFSAVKDGGLPDPLSHRFRTNPQEPR